MNGPEMQIPDRIRGSYALVVIMTCVVVYGGLQIGDALGRNTPGAFRLIAAICAIVLVAGGVQACLHRSFWTSVIDLFALTLAVFGGVLVTRIESLSGAELGAALVLVALASYAKDRLSPGPARARQIDSGRGNKASAQRQRGRIFRGNGGRS